MRFEGKLTYIGQKQEGTSQAGNAWAKVDIVVTENGTEYPNELLATAWNDKLEQFHGIRQGDDVVVDCDMKVREYNGRRYQDIKLWKIAKAGQVVQTAVAPQPQAETAVMTPTAAKVADLFQAAPVATARKKQDHDFNQPDENDGLPF